MLLVIALVLVILHHNQKISDLQVKVFNKERDTQFILNCFEQDRYWLTNNPEFSAQYMIDHMTPKPDPAYFGKQNIVLLYFKDQPVGFGAYYMKSFYEGFIHFLYINKAERGKGYSAVLMRYMMNQLSKMGSKFIKLCTRVNNVPARSLYRKLGFKELEPDEQGFVYFEMRQS